MQVFHMVKQVSKSPEVQPISGLSRRAFPTQLIIFLISKFT